MKTVLLVAGGRGGSDFFQGLLDGHKEILSFPGYLRIDQKFIDILNQNTCTQIAKKFIELYPHFFNSKNNFFERHHRLGKNKDKYFTVNKKKFVQCFDKLYNDKIWNADTFRVVNHQNKNTTILKWENRKLDVGLNKKDFEKSSLQKLSN